MGLFSDAKNELDKENEQENEDIFAATDEDIDVSNVDTALLDSILEDTKENETEEKEEEEEKSEADASPAPAVPQVAERKIRDTKEDVGAVTVITKGTTINGSIISDCSLEVMGTINGDIECLGKLTITGNVSGNSRAAEVFVNTDRLEGSIYAEGCVKVGLGTVVVGDITATSAVFAGAVKGEVDVNGPVVLDSTAIVKGNIKAKAVQMNNGAVLDGFCSLSYAELDVDSIFE